MTKRGKEDFHKYFIWIVMAFLAFLSYKIAQPYLIVLISAFILSYLVRPLYLKLNKNLKIGKSFSAIISIFLILLIILIPLGAIIGGLTIQASNLLENFPTISEKVSNISFLKNIDVEEISKKGVELIFSISSSALSYIPSLLISLIVLTLGIYYMLINWDALSNKLKQYIPFEDKKRIANEISQATNGLIYGTLLIAIIEFVVAVIGFYISGVELYLLLPSLIFFLAFIPGLGATIAWVPLAVYYFITGNIFVGIGVVITGLILSIYIDTILRTKILGKKAKLNPLIMLIGILGGISLFGVFGFIIGPLVLIYTLELIENMVNGD